MRLSLPILAIAIVLTTSGCEGLKDSQAALFYHNLTARDNGYFNAREKTKVTRQILWDAHIDDFTKVLPVYPIPTKSDAAAQAPNFDIVIKKSARVVVKHKPSKWTDDSYVLVAISNFYKGDYFAALETFNYVAQQFDNTLAAHQARIWQASTYLALGKPKDAQGILSTITSRKDLPEELKVEFKLVEADVFIANNSYEQALESLKGIEKKVKGKRMRIRTLFIMGQLHQRLGHRMEAERYYVKVMRRNPPYVYAFQSRIALIDVSDDKEQVKRALLKLLKDDKNLGYQDQIYYQLGRIELAQKNTNAAITYLKKSASISKENPNQKATSYLLLGDIYFAQPRYVEARKFYDSAANFLTSTYPDYASFTKRQQLLGQLIDNLLTVQMQDSLLRLASLPKSELDVIVDSLVARDKRRATSGVPSTNANTSNFGNNAANAYASSAVAPSSGSTPGYFYNTNTLTAGFTSFRQKFGDRPLVDNWRQKARITSTINNELTSGDGGSNSPRTSANETDLRQKYYSSLPTNGVLQNAANSTIQNSLYAVGNIYFQELGEYEEASRYYRQLLYRFPDNQHAISAYYSLYKLYDVSGQPLLSEAYKDTLLTRFPESDQANLIRNPEASRARVIAATTRNPALELLYKNVFEAFNIGDCNAVRTGLEESRSTFPGNDLDLKFQYLNLLCPGKKDTTKALIDSITAFGYRNKSNVLGLQASKVAKAMEQARASKSARSDLSAFLPQGAVAPLDKTGYVKNLDADHRFVLFYPANLDPNKIKIAFSNFHASNYANRKFDISSVLVNADYQMLVIKGLETYGFAADYAARYIRHPSFTSTLGLEYSHVVLLTSENLQLFSAQKDVDALVNFYTSNY